MQLLKQLYRAYRATIFGVGKRCSDLKTFTPQSDIRRGLVRVHPREVFLAFPWALARPYKNSIGATRRCGARNP